ncbi:MAG: pyruvate dehydrogenase complex E1 component subunit beta [Chloroflexota bacterium]|nr:pyruvate dehydrogenase complex E1 component subunit beta [Chloroflexota bacterium]
MPVKTYREALNETLREEMHRDPDVFVIGEDVGKFQGAYRVTQGLLEEFGPRRVKDAPISETAIAGAGIGAGMLGLRPVIEFMTINFTLVAIDQIVNHAAKIHYMFGGQVSVPIVIRTPGGGGQQLTAQHSQNLEHWYAHVPGLKVVAPSSPADAKGLLRTAIRDDDPVFVLENLALYNTRGEVPEGEYTVPFGKADVKRAGTDISIISHSRMVNVSLQAAQRLEAEGVSAEVVDLRSLRPLDTETIVASVRKTNRAMTVEEGWPTFGVGAEIVSILMDQAFDYLDAPVKRVGGEEVPMPYSKPLERAAIPSVDKILRTAREVLA